MGKNTQRKKMRGKVFKAILIPVLSLLLIINVLLTFAATSMESTLNTFLGKGEVVTVKPKGSDSISADYYSELYKNSQESKEAAYDISRQVSSEGTVLLKNNGILPLEKGSEITPFGRGFIEPIYGQLNNNGSAKWVIAPVTPEAELKTLYNLDMSVINLLLENEPEILKEAPGTLEAGASGSMLGGNSFIYEYNSEIYNEIEGNKESTGIIFLTRSGQEGSDKKYDAYSDGTPHFLAISENEKGAIKAAKERCKNVIVVIVSSAPMELGPIASGELEADAIIWAGHPGERGFNTLADIISGDITPSGRTVDTFPEDFRKDPSYQNFGSFEYSNYKAKLSSYEVNGEINKFYNDYQEDIYVGYRYYETAHDIDPEFNYGNRDSNGKITYSGEVCYPFGYGLSYTTFEQKITEYSDNGDNIEIKVSVKNSGDKYSGKDVVQLYYKAPYTDFDKEYSIEKSTANLAAFKKTSLLEPGESEVLSFTIPKEDMASYCYTVDNKNGTKGSYVLEMGDYELSLRKNSHDIIETRTTNIPATIWYNGESLENFRKSDIDAQSILNSDGTITKIAEGDYIAPSNQFQTSSDYMNRNSYILTRKDWKNSFPKTVENRTKELNKGIAYQLGIESTFDVFTDPTYGNVEGSKVYRAEAPLSNQKNGLTLSDLRGADYNDEKWNLLLDQIDWNKDKDGILQLFSGAAYAMESIYSISMPATEQKDGANGLKVQGTDNGYDMTKSSSFGFQPLMAATWNIDLMYEVGTAFGQEALSHNITGWYSPGINIHRSPFGGRAFEYYSEDPLLSGKIASAVVSGAGDQGLVTYIKHFALNDTETNRSKYSSSWATEQAMREIYLKAFEIPFKEARMTIKYLSENGEMKEKVMRAATATMPAQNGVGTIMGTCNDALLNSVLRDEWGFKGMVISDYWVWNDNNFRDLSLRSGMDAYLCMYMPMMWSVNDYESPTARWVMRNSIHNIAYTLANSNAMQGAVPGTSFKLTAAPWKKAFIAINIVSYIFIIFMIFVIIRRSRDEKLNPAKYKSKRIKK